MIASLNIARDPLVKDPELENSSQAKYVTT